MKDPHTKQEVDIRKLSYEKAYDYLQQQQAGMLTDVSEYEVDLLRQRLVTVLEGELWLYEEGKKAIKDAVAALKGTPLKVEWGKNTRAEYESGRVSINAPEKKADGMAILVFELTNMALTPQYKALDNAAAQGFVARNVYIWENERLEVENSLVAEFKLVQSMLNSKNFKRKDFGERLTYLIEMEGKHVGDIINLGTKEDDPLMKQHLAHYAAIWDKYYEEAYNTYVKKNGEKGLYKAKDGTKILPELTFPEDTLSKEEVNKTLYGSSSDEEDFLSKLPKPQHTQKPVTDDVDDIFS